MNDTIVAVATAYGVGSIAIIRLSGEAALSIAKSLTLHDTFTPRHATLRSVHSPQGELIDEAIVIYFAAPKSFTGEDVVELQCHGGSVVARQIVEAALASGARLAEPGEFSKRAFLNGRIDLTQAEAIAKLIEAKSEDAAKILAQQMKGSLKGYVEEVRDQLLEILAYSEVTIDYAEEDLPEDLIEQMLLRLDTLHAGLHRTLQASQSRKGLMQGFKVAIVGKPNVGKSSLLNALLNFNRAIVSDIAGTTRDTVEEEVRIGTHLIRMVDTAGIREASDEIERIGIERSIEAIEQSDIVIALFDGSRAIDEEDRAIIDLMNRYGDSKELVTVVNKSDLLQRFERSALQGFQPIAMSCKAETAQLVDVLRSIMDSQNASDDMMLISTRQIDAVQTALREIEEAKGPLQDQELEFFSFHLNRAIRAVSSISRPFEHDEMLDKMFGSFCLGK